MVKHLSILKLREKIKVPTIAGVTKLLPLFPDKGTIITPTNTVQRGFCGKHV
jgi:hypothetical protein